MTQTPINPFSSQIQLTARRLRILELLSEHSFMTMAEALEIFANRRHAFKIVRELGKWGLIEFFPTHLIPRKAFALTPLGWQFLEGSGRLRAREAWRKERYAPSLFFHTLAGLRCRIILEKLPQVSGWIPDSLLPRTKDERCADAEFDFTGRRSGKTARVALEVELTLKSPRGRQEMIRLLDEREDLHRVLWVCREESIARLILEGIQQSDLLDPKKHFFVYLDELFREKNKANWYDLSWNVVAR